MSLRSSLGHRGVKPDGLTGVLWVKNQSFSWENGIEGEAIIKVESDVVIHGIWIELVTLCTSWPFPFSKTKRLVLTENDVKCTNPTHTLVGKSYVGKWGPTHHVSIPTGTHKYSFNFPISNFIIPASFKSEYVQVEHRLVLMGDISPGGPFALNQIPLNSTGNLMLPHEMAKSVEVVVKKGKSLLSTKKIRISFWLSKRGYVPGNVIRGSVRIANSLQESLFSTEVSCVKILSYEDSGFVRKETEILDTKTAEICSTSYDKIRIRLNKLEKNEFKIEKFALNLPHALMPSWRSADGSFKLEYNVQFVILSESGKEYKSSLGIAVGTHAMDGMAEVNVLDSDFTNLTGSTDSLISGEEEFDRNSPTQSMDSLPPAYSQLSSRRSSVSTLPPDYETVATE